ncbi:MAG: helicase-related protein [Candidatus Omnitrophota bacterium]
MDNQEKQSEERIADHIFETLRGSNNLIFANKKSDVEVYADKLRTISERQKLPNEFFPHHGSLSKEIRQDVEKRLKDKHLPTNVICTSTLEMGIDIGDVKSVAQLDCPPSVSSMKQRIGRSGRRDTDPSILRIYIQESEITKSSHCGDMMREDLFQSVAMTELLLKKWVEPPDGNILHLSTLIQQILSVIAQYGGIKAENCWKLLCQNGPFGKIGPNKFAELLRNLGKHEIIMQTHEGLLLLGIKGERIVNHYQFYAAFVTNDEYRLITEGKTLGTIPISYPVIKDMYIIFAGRRWIVIDVNEEQKVIILQPSPGGIPPKFSNSGALIHDEIRNKMFQLYSSEYIPVYLNEEARKLFMEGRDNFRRLKLDIFNLIKMGPNTLLFPWVGDKSINTLGVLLMSKGLKVSQAGFLLEILNITPADLLPYLEEISQRDSIDLIGLASIVKCKNQEKYDHFLTENLLCAEYAARNLNIESAQKCAASIFEKGI